MPRPRVKRAPGGLPAVLMDLDAPEWQSAAAYEAWLLAMGLERHDGRRCGGPVERHHDAVCAYAISLGHYRTYGTSTWKWPDLAWVRECGAPVFTREHEHDAHLRAVLAAITVNN